MKNIMRLKYLLSILLLLGLLAGCSNEKEAKTTTCGDSITLHKNGEEFIVNKREIVMVERYRDTGSHINFNRELEEVNGLTRGSGVVFDESLEEVNKLINCEN